MKGIESILDSIWILDNKRSLSFKYLLIGLACVAAACVTFLQNAGLNNRLLILLLTVLVSLFMFLLDRFLFRSLEKKKQNRVRILMAVVLVQIILVLFWVKPY